MFTALAAGLITGFKLVGTGALLGIGFGLSRHIVAAAEFGYAQLTGKIDELAEQFKKENQQAEIGQ